MDHGPKHVRLKRVCFKVTEQYYGNVAKRGHVLKDISQELFVEAVRQWVLGPAPNATIKIEHVEATRAVVSGQPGLCATSIAETTAFMRKGCLAMLARLSERAFQSDMCFCIPLTLYALG